MPVALGGYAPVVRRLSRRDHPSARTAAVAAYSKASDIDRSTVDFSTLAELVARLDAAPSDGDDVTRMYLGRLACKLRDTDVGARLIGDMATRGVPLRVVAVHAIATDLSTEPPSDTSTCSDAYRPRGHQTRNRHAASSGCCSRC
jgi:hypothetical protein